MQPIWTLWKILVGELPGTIPIEFGQIPIAVQEKKLFEVFLI